jgi:parallel beta-helix repeat protein
MNGGSITGNSDSGVYVSSGTFAMSGGSITGNTASLNGGGVFVSDSGTFAMSGGSITGNTASYSGGGVYVSDSGTFTMSGGSISGNTVSSSSPSYGGGGVYVSSGSFTMSGGSITGNSVSNYGGGVFVGSGSFTMSGGSIMGNSAYGVYVWSGNSATFTMSNYARIDPSNRVYLPNGSSIAIAGGFGGNDTVAVLDLDGSAVDWLGKSVLLRATGYAGTISAGCFGLGDFSGSTPIGNNYVIDSNGKLANK